MIAKLPEELHVNLNGKEGYVTTNQYVVARTKDLREFGYNTLTQKEVEDQVLKILNGEKLNVIGMFMENEIIKEN